MNTGWSEQDDMDWNTAGQSISSTPKHDRKIEALEALIARPGTVHEGKVAQEMLRRLKRKVV